MNQLIAVQVNEQEEQFMNQIIESKGSNLPEKIDDVVRVFEFSDLKAKAFKLIADKMLKLEEQNELYHSALRSSQKWSIASLYAQKRMGEIISKIESAPEALKKDIIKNEGIQLRTAYKMQEIASHPDILEQVIEHAQNNDEVPTKTAVLKAIKHKKDMEWVDNANKESINKQIKKRDNQVNDQVKMYLDTIKGFNVALDYAIIDAENGKFSPESKNFIIKKHKEIIEKLNKLEASI